MKYALNIIGSFIIDFIVLFNDFVEYCVIGGLLVYSWKLPFSLHLGDYLFMAEKDYKKVFNKRFS
jgi:hypothetical protein